LKYLPYIHMSRQTTSYKTSYNKILESINELGLYIF